jgi:queuosine precursor transporter
MTVLTEFLRPTSSFVRLDGTVVVVLMAYLGAIFAANWAFTTGLSVSTLSYDVPVGALFAGAVFTLRDVLQETSGAFGVVLAVLTSAILVGLLASPLVTTASVAAFVISEFVDSVVYTRMRAWSRVHAVIGSNVIGLFIDSVIFIPIATGSTIALPGHILGKTIATTLTVALLLIATSRRKAARP